MVVIPQFYWDNINQTKSEKINGNKKEDKMKESFYVLSECIVLAFRMSFNTIHILTFLV